MLRELSRSGAVAGVFRAVAVLAVILGAAGCRDEPRGPAAVATPAATPVEVDPAAWQVHPGGDIQAALEQAAADPVRKKVQVRAGTYRPQVPGQAFVWFNERHDGITLEAVGRVVMTAANPEVADETADSYPAIVNHVVYFGDRISQTTTLRGFEITGANNFVTRDDQPGPIQPDTGIPKLEKNLFFYADGGGIKIFGRSYPTIENVIVHDNYSSPCGAGVSIEHRDFKQRPVIFRNCVFRNNRAQVTGSGVDILRGSSAEFHNCLFVDNLANMGEDFIGLGSGRGYNEEHGSGALTVFAHSRAVVDRCTFTGNWNGVDDRGPGNVYLRSIFWKNDRGGGISPGARYELDILNASRVENCFINGETNDLRGTLDAERNVLDAPDPRFDDSYRPRSPVYADVGYRPPGS
ncbi:MAG: right-handed parallel beta-helix repeat-containing protein [Myxococcales bacterium]|nr:MAG: right-handed parallel beta-helix repeat-containing protein [Myxococcales bacterium]